jgi:hypothetical protein
MTNLDSILDGAQYYDGKSAALIHIVVCESTVVEAAAELASLRADLKDEKARTALFEDCLHRALEIWRKQNPDAMYWPDGAQNIADTLSQYAALRARVDELLEYGDTWQKACQKADARATELEAALAKTDPWKGNIEPFRNFPTYKCIYCGAVYNDGDETPEKMHKADCLWLHSFLASHPEPK